MTNDNNKNKQVETILTEDCFLSGTLKFNRSIQFDGKLKGKIQAPEGSIIIGENAHIEAEIVIDNLSNRGKIKGAVRAMNLVRIYNEAEIKGNVKTKEIIIDKGGRLNGLCITGKEKDESENTSNIENKNTTENKSL